LDSAEPGIAQVEEYVGEAELVELTYKKSKPDSDSTVHTIFCWYPDGDDTDLGWGGEYIA